MPNHALTSQRVGWSEGSFPPELTGWPASSTNSNHASPLRSGTTSPRGIGLNAYAAQAIIAYVQKSTARLALVDGGNGMTYSAEMELPDGSSMVATMNRPSAGTNTLNLRAAIVSGTGAYIPVPAISSSSDVDLSPVYLCLLAFMMKEYSQVHDDVGELETEYAATGAVTDGGAFRRVADSLVVALNDRLFEVSVPGSNIDLLAQQSVTLGSLNGAVLCGNPKILAGDSGIIRPNGRQLTFAEAKTEFNGFASSRTWTAEERALIPVFPEDYPVPDEALKIARFYVKTRKDRRPMNNFMWRGITSYGKSTGIELMAGFLGMPLLRMTCHSTTETQNFLSDFVPDNGVSAAVVEELPSFMEISADPVSAYKALTGTDDDAATCEMCLKAYGDAVLARNGGNGARFKHVESNFVRALSHGYIVEVQEISRIKDSGVLVGLNEFDRPGAVIPLVDGSFTRRDPDAMVVYTDNVGYASCRAIDPSVIRRTALILDSYEMPKDRVISRVLYNTGFPDSGMLDKMYDTWMAVQTHCKEQDIMEGSVSVTELEMWAQAVEVDGMKNLTENCRSCVVAKATSDPIEQESIMADVVAVHLGM